MRDAATEICSLIHGLEASDIQGDAIRRSALLWQFTVLGEAANQISASVKESNPQIAWRAATRMRNRIVHGYWDIDIETLIATAADDLPQMIVRLEDLIGAD
ncbi:MAG: DUF86 domain-containing protein [Acidipropionibacterium sp.]|jgi:uncharacterized protein with HEPN domain|nr:DUF86 domain-containing protein [Acidipropionibacterium sp.]